MRLGSLSLPKGALYVDITGVFLLLPASSTDRCIEIAGLSRVRAVMRCYCARRALGEGWRHPFDRWVRALDLPIHPACFKRRDYTMANVEPTPRSVDATRSIADRVRRQTRNADILALCDAVLAASPVAPVSSHHDGCLVCAARRKAKAETQKRWRRNRGARS